MSLFKNLLLFLATMLLYSGISAQTVTIVSSPYVGDTCGNMVILNNPSGLTSWNWLDAYNTVLQSQGDTLYNVCPGDYSLSYTSSGGPGTYNFTVDPSLCSISSLDADVSTTPTGTNTCTGTGTVSVSGGSAPYAYSWYNGTTTANTGNLCPGYAYVTVTDSQGCTVWATGLVTTACSGFDAYGISDTIVTGCDGEISVGVIGGTAPYSYVWDNGANTQTISGLCAGTYSGTVTDANGCMQVFWATVYDPCTNFFTYASPSASTDSMSCNGAISLAAYGYYPYDSITYTINGVQTGTYITDLCPGTYTIVVTAGGCSSTEAITIIDSSSSYCILPVVLSGIASTDSMNCNGMVAATISGGTGIYSYQWSTGSNDTSLVNICDGYYTLNVYDSNGCSGFAYIYLGDINPCMGFYGGVSYSNPSSAMACDGTATANGMGGTLPYSFYWSTQDSTATVNGLCVGPHTVTVSDANGCAFDMTIDLYSYDTLYSLGGYAYSTDETEDGACDGTATVYPYGGVSPYQIYHSSGATTATATGLCAGVHTAVIVDANGDTVVVSYLISTPGNVIINEPYPDSTVIDSLWNDLIENCTIDYSSIDSAYIDSANWFTADSIAVTWVVYDANGVSYITQTYYIGGGNGLYTFVLSVYCPQKTTGQFLKVYEQLYVGESLGMDENVAVSMAVYPNPFSEEFSIDFGQAGDYSVVLHDMTGRVMLQQQVQNESSMKVNDLGQLAKGEYLLQITGKTGTITKKLVK